jgi:hypothetical protein
MQRTEREKKMNINRRSVFTMLAAVVLGAGILPSAIAQDAARDTPRGTVVVYPVVFSRNSGDDTSRKTAVRSVQEVLQKAGYTMISNTVASNAWRHMGIPMPMADSPASTADIVRFGQGIKARYVVSVVFDFHSRSIWVDLGPRTVSTVTMDVVITDVEQGKTVYDREDISGRSDEKFDLLKAGADILITPLVTVVSGGPKTHHEQRAAQIAVSKALRGWVHASDE